VIEIDARGLPCPRPVVETRKALQGIDDEAAIVVVVDSLESRENVQRFARSQGCQVEVKEEDGVFRLTIARGQAVEAAQKAEPDLVDAAKGDVVVVISTDRFGSGDERLGEILMKAFLNTLWDREPRPARLLFINSGVRLTTEGSEVLDALELLEQDGVQVLSCGTCLEYYGIKDSLRVGAVTNMYEMVDFMLSASKVLGI
jgi:selenium metabolism protein YedF